MNAIRNETESVEFLHVLPPGRAAGLAKGVALAREIPRQSASVLDFCRQNYLDLQARIELALFISGTVAKFHELDIGFSSLSSSAIRIEYESGDLVCDLEDCGPIELLGSHPMSPDLVAATRPPRRANIVQASNLIQFGEILRELSEPEEKRPDELRSMIIQSTSLRTGFRYPSLADLNEALADWLRSRLADLASISTFPGRWTWV